jgi:hypothetical protein
LQQQKNAAMTIPGISAKTIRNALLWTGAFVAYRLYKLYELGDSVVYKPVAVQFRRGGTINDFVVRVKMELMNPGNTAVSVRRVSGRLITGNQTVGYFASNPFTINPGLNYFFMDFRIDAKNVGAPLVRAIIEKKMPVLYVEMTTALPFFSTTETFAINPEITTTEQVFVN